MVIQMANIQSTVISPINLPIRTLEDVIGQSPIEII